MLMSNLQRKHLLALFWNSSARGASPAPVGHPLLLWGILHLHSLTQFL